MCSLPFIVHLKVTRKITMELCVNKYIYLQTKALILELNLRSIKAANAVENPPASESLLT